MNTIPCLAWNPGSGSGQFDNWSGGTKDADLMINDLCDKIVAIMPDTSFFDNYVIYSQPDPDDLPTPVAQGTLGTQGLDTTPGWYKAVQVTMNFRTNLFGIMKIVVLDAATNNNFDKTTVLPGSGALFDIFNQLTSSTNGWSGQDNGQVAGFISQTITLNEKLRRAYRMA